ncbi:unnamed protein product [Fraxinus pennsylvanica]|uniref:Uncharacterized protein n=1 Tax=Fraxinus pennsylvanica TaxID=56036 RepID=A0AAD2A6D5_9LAMI|nr:unnamed protein product [Fraxinus pennsylvanica]
MHGACYSNTNSKNNKKFKAIDLQKLIQDSPKEFDTKDSPASLPRPLTFAQLSNLSSGVKESGIPLFFLLRGQESPGRRWQSSCGLRDLSRRRRREVEKAESKWKLKAGAVRMKVSIKTDLMILRAFHL